MSEFSEAHGAAAAISLTLRNNPKTAETMVAICAIASYDSSTGTWTHLRDAGMELSSYVRNLASSGEYSDLDGIDFGDVDWEALVKGEIDE